MDKPALEILAESKGLKNLELLLSYTKDIKEFTQDSAILDHYRNEVLDSSLSSILVFTKEMKNTNKSLSLLSKNSLNNDNDIEAEYVNLSESSIKDIVKYSSKPLAVDEPQEDPTYHLVRVSDSLHGLLDVQKEVRDLIVRQNTLPSTMTDLDNASQIYHQKSTYYLTAINDKIEGILTILKGSEVDVGGTRNSIGDKKEDKDNGGGFFDSILDLLGLTAFARGGKKLFDKLTGAIDWVLSPITNALKKMGEKISEFAGKMFGPLIEKFMGTAIGKKLANSTIFKGATKIFSKLLPMAKGLTRLIPGVGQAVTLAMAAWDFGKGVKNASEIVGKAKEDLTYMDKFNAGISEVISSITFGFIDAKTIYKYVKWFEDSVVEVFNNLMALFPASVKTGIKKIWGVLFDENTGVFGSLTKGFQKIIDYLGDGEYLSALWQGVKTTLQLIPSAIGKLIGMTVDGFKDLIGADKLKSAGDFLSKLMDTVLDIISNFIGEKSFGLLGGKQVKEGISGVAKTASNVVGSAAKSVGSFFGFTSEDEAKPAQAKKTAVTVNQAKLVPQIGENKIVPVAPIATAKPIAQPIMAQKTVQLTKNKEESKGNVVINQPPPVINLPQSKDQPKVERRTRAGSETILHLNSATGRP